MVGINDVGDTEMTDVSAQPTPLGDSGNRPTQAESTPSAKKAPSKMSFEDYKRLSNMLVMYMRRREEQEELSTGNASFFSSLVLTFYLLRQKLYGTPVICNNYKILSFLC